MRGWRLVAVVAGLAVLALAACGFGAEHMVELPMGSM